MSRAKRMLIGCGLVLGAGAFFLLGILVAQRMESRERAQPPIAPVGASSSPSGRRMFLPSIADDPYVLEQWKDAVERLERRCRDVHEYCAEAAAARAQMKGI